MYYPLLKNPGTTAHKAFLGIKGNGRYFSQVRVTKNY